MPGHTLICRGGSEYLTMQNIVSGRFWIPPSAGAALTDLINQLLRRDPSQRLGFRSIDDLKAHAAFEGM